MNKINKANNGIIQQLVFRNKADKVFVGAKINSQWFGFGLFESKEKFPLTEGQMIRFEYTVGESFGEVNLQTVQVNANSSSNVDSTASETHSKQLEGQGNANPKGSDKNAKQSQNSSNKAKVKPKAKLYGEVIKSNESSMVVELKDDKLGDVFVVLDSEKYDEVKKAGSGDCVGARFTGFSEYNEEKKGYEIKSGFKVYKPVKEVKQSELVEKISPVQDAPFNSKERQFKMTVGNLMNVAAIACKCDIDGSVVLAKELYPKVEELRVKLITQYKEARSDGDISSKLGDCLKHAAFTVSQQQNSVSVVDDICKLAEEWVHKHIEVEDYLNNI
jgi:hypothetical protein